MKVSKYISLNFVGVLSYLNSFQFQAVYQQSKQGQGQGHRYLWGPFVLIIFRSFISECTGSSVFWAGCGSPWIRKLPLMKVHHHQIKIQLQIHQTPHQIKIQLQIHQLQIHQTPHPILSFKSLTKQMQWRVDLSLQSRGHYKLWRGSQVSHQHQSKETHHTRHHHPTLQPVFHNHCLCQETHHTRHHHPTLHPVFFLPLIIVLPRCEGMHQFNIGMRVHPTLHKTQTKIH